MVDIFWESTLVFFVAYKPADSGNTEQPWLVQVTLAVSKQFLSFWCFSVIKSTTATTTTTTIAIVLQPLYMYSALTLLAGFPCILESTWIFSLLNSRPWKYLKTVRCLKVLEFHWIHQVKLRDMSNYVKQHLYRTGMHILSIWQVFCLNQDLLIIVMFCFYQLKLYRNHTNRY